MRKNSIYHPSASSYTALTRFAFYAFTGNAFIELCCYGDASPVRHDDAAAAKLDQSTVASRD